MVMSVIDARADEDMAGLDLLTAARPRRLEVEKARTGADPYRAPMKVPLEASAPNMRVVSPRTALLSSRLALGLSPRSNRPLSAPVSVKASPAPPPPSAAGVLTARPSKGMRSTKAKSSWGRGWQESERERERRNDELFDSELKRQDRDNIAARGLWNALRDLAMERESDLEQLKGEYALLMAHVATDGGDRESLSTRRDELQHQFELASEMADEEDHNVDVRDMMEERLALRRPHLERKLAFMRSEHVEFAVRYDVQVEAMEVARAFEERMAAMLELEKTRVAEQREANDEKRNAMRADLANSGSARRRRQIEAMSGSTSAQQMEFLQTQVASDQAALDGSLMAERHAAAQKADATYVAGTSAVDAKSKATTTAAGMAREQALAKVDPRKQAWQKLSIIADADNLKQVLEYWEDKTETRTTLEQALSAEPRTCLASLHSTPCSVRATSRDRPARRAPPYQPTTTLSRPAQL